MKNCRIDAVLKLLLLFKFTISSSSSMNSDGLSLLALKAAITEDPTKSLVSWSDSDSDSSPCNWAGILCNQPHSRVTAVSLAGRNLTGYIPSEIGALSFLTSLDLSRNSFSGPLPFQITTLQNLIHLDVSSNNLNGLLPQDLTNLTRLEGSLNLSYNAFSGEIPASFGRFPVMISLDLSHNNLTGKIPMVGSLLNQGPTAFSGNPYLCGFPLNIPCSEPEAQNPRFLDNPKNSANSSHGTAENRKLKTGLLSFFVICGFSLVMGVVFASVWVVKRKRNMEDKTGRENMSLEVVRREEGQKSKFVIVDEGFGLDLEDLLRASAYVLGKSRSGIVYRVVVPGTGGGAAVVAAVRRVSEGETARRLKEFEAEVEAIGKVQHPNIVKLKAYYYSSDEKLLISDFVANGSLHDALHGGENKSALLSWATRLRIAQETARGLTHIHDRRYIHGNIKSSKILLDQHLKPYISGFGLSRLVPQTSTPSFMKQTAASPYAAPEFQDGASKLTQKCDVFSFGVVLLEIVTGRFPEGVEGVVRRVFEEERPLSEIIDPHLLNEVRAKKQVVAIFHVALSCTQPDPDSRPKMGSVSQSLECIKL